jgi:hypothetical protein
MTPRTPHRESPADRLIALTDELEELCTAQIQTMVPGEAQQRAQTELAHALVAVAMRLFTRSGYLERPGMVEHLKLAIGLALDGGAEVSKRARGLS